MIHALLDLPSHLRDRLESALESGLLGPSPSAASLRSLLGNREDVEGLVAALLELAQFGVSGAGSCRLASSYREGCFPEAETRPCLVRA